MSDPCESCNGTGEAKPKWVWDVRSAAEDKALAMTLIVEQGALAALREAKPEELPVRLRVWRERMMQND